MNDEAARRAWRAIVAATALLMPAFWAAPIAAVAAAPFVFIVLGVVSRQHDVPRAVLRAMGLSLLVGSFVTVLFVDAASGVVAGIGAGGAVSLRNESRGWRPRAIAVGVAAVYTLVLVLALGTTAVLFAPLFPLTALGVADHVAEWRARRVVA